MCDYDKYINYLFDDLKDLEIKEVSTLKFKEKEKGENWLSLSLVINGSQEVTAGGLITHQNYFFDDEEVKEVNKKYKIDVLNDFFKLKTDLQEKLDVPIYLHYLGFDVADLDRSDGSTNAELVDYINDSFADTLKEDLNRKMQEK